MIGVAAIVPTFNERENLPALADDLRREGVGELVVADGESTDGTTDLARSLGAKVVTSPRCRGVQLNLGASVAEAPILLFVHADSRLPPGMVTAMERALDRDGVVLGAFALRIEMAAVSTARRISLSLVAGGATLRARLFSLPYGDQGLFMTRVTFDRLGGFPPIKRCEDLDLVLRARRLGRVVTMPIPITTSGRRWNRDGTWRTSARNVRDAVRFVLDSARKQKAEKTALIESKSVETRAHS